jgi:hypothetical protein
MDFKEGGIEKWFLQLQLIIVFLGMLHCIERQERTRTRQIAKKVLVSA